MTIYSDFTFEITFFGSPNYGYVNDRNQLSSTTDLTPMIATNKKSYNLTYKLVQSNISPLEIVVSAFDLNATQVNT